MLVVAGACGAAGVSFAAPTPKALSRAILAAARAQNSVHYTRRDVVGAAFVTFTGDVAKAEGLQTVTLKVGKKSGSIKILIVGGIAYLRGDAFGLHALGQLTTAQASGYAGRWISIPSSDRLYATTAADVTLGTFVTHLAPHGRLSMFRARIRGTKVVGVRAIWGKKKHRTLEVLDAHARGKHLPLEQEIFTPGDEFLSKCVMNHWNEPVNPQAPSNAVPISTVRGTRPRTARSWSRAGRP